MSTSYIPLSVHMFDCIPDNLEYFVLLLCFGLVDPQKECQCLDANNWVKKKKYPFANNLHLTEACRDMNSRNHYIDFDLFGIPLRTLLGKFVH
mmetsp:Transcript_38408/g.62179  ORF Transcript_38408/g.62179 Transcript_38408/m.62179 type:complete len:93 (-) Transcript_38408:805-1083(-)